MSINSAMLAGVSGLVANSSALAAISDNIANVNTIAYKRNQVNFSSVVTSQSAGRYSAGGVHSVTHQFVSQQGLVQSATSPTDLAISGDGFFITTQKAANVTPADARLFTRAGAFAVDAQGFLANDAGLYLQGWAAQPGGGFATNPSDMNQLSSINVKNLGAAVSPTTTVALNANVNKQEVVSAQEAAYTAANNAVGSTMADYAVNPALPAATKPDFTVEMTVIDSVGASHKLAMAFLKSSAAANEWHAEIYAVPATDVNVGALPPGQLANGLVKFKLDGSIDLANSTLFGVAGAPTVLTLGQSGTILVPGTPPAWADPLGIDAQTITLDLTKMSQLAENSSVRSVTPDGAGVGNVVGVQIDSEGVVSAIFDNSQVRQIAKIALATFPNADGLLAVSGNAYRGTLAAGQLVIKEPGDAVGHIAPSSLEASTVDLSAEFTGLISTQKAYSASSKIITTADQMLTELINIIR